MNIKHTFTLSIILIISSLFAACTKEDTASMKADFEYSFTDDNNVVFTNSSEGTYYSLHWDFDNETTVETTDKNKTIATYYPKAGDYTVTLTIKNDAGNSNTTNQTISILKDDPDYVEPDGLVWSDEFNGPGINLNSWTFETGANGWGNNELQNYTNGSNAHIKDGKLILTARKVDDNLQYGSYSSTRMITLGKKEFTYGRIEVRAKLPSGRGLWPAIWMLGANINSAGWPACGEIDIMEYVGYEPNTVHSTVHTAAGYAGNGDGNHKTVETCEEEFHIYGINWTESSITFYVDSPDNVVHTYAPAIKNTANWPFDKPHFFILNIAVGGTWGGLQGVDNTIFPQTMEVDYVRVFEE